MIEFKNVSKTYDNGTKALKNVNLRINKGEFVFVVGASGAGKSTFLKLIMHEEVPNSGTVSVNGHNLVAMTKKEIPYYRRTMGIVFQDFRLIPNMTVYDNVAFAMRVIGAREKEIRKRVPYVLGLVGLNAKAGSLPTQLSGGEQQRVALARALVNNAGLIIADEPTGNIDPEMSYEIVDLLNHINANGTTVVMVTHEHNLVRSFQHRVVVIDNGTVASDTAAQERAGAVNQRRARQRPGTQQAYYYAEGDKAAQSAEFIRSYAPAAEKKQPRRQKAEPPAQAAQKKAPAKQPKRQVQPAEQTKPAQGAQRPEASARPTPAKPEGEKIDYSIYLEHLSEIGGAQDEKR